MTVVNKVSSSRAHGGRGRSGACNDPSSLVCGLRTSVQHELSAAVYTILCLCCMRLHCEEAGNYFVPRLRHKRCEDVVPNQPYARRRHIHWFQEFGEYGSHRLSMCARLREGHAFDVAIPKYPRIHNIQELDHYPHREWKSCIMLLLCLPPSRRLMAK